MCSCSFAHCPLRSSSIFLLLHTLSSSWICSGALKIYYKYRLWKYLRTCSFDKFSCNKLFSQSLCRSLATKFDLSSSNMAHCCAKSLFLICKVSSSQSTSLLLKRWHWSVWENCSDLSCAKIKKIEFKKLKLMTLWDANHIWIHWRCVCVHFLNQRQTFDSMS